MAESNDPARLYIVRHGESLGNVARDRAMLAGAERIELKERDVDVPLSPLGFRQAEALGRWLADLRQDRRPEVVIASPYRRARQTAETALKAGGGFHLPANGVVTDERLREREFGVLDRLTTEGIRRLHPEQAALRRELGKFYHRPPGGESWCDVILRLRSFLDTLRLCHAGQRVLIVCHQVVVLCLRYVLEEMDEAAILAIDRQGDVINCSVTEYALNARGRLELVRYNHAEPVTDEGERVTAEPSKESVAG